MAPPLLPPLQSRPRAAAARRRPFVRAGVLLGMLAMCCAAGTGCKSEPEGLTVTLGYPDATGWAPFATGDTLEVLANVQAIPFLRLQARVDGLDPEASWLSLVVELDIDGLVPETLNVAWLGVVDVAGESSRFTDILTVPLDSLDATVYRDRDCVVSMEVTDDRGFSGSDSVDVVLRDDSDCISGNGKICVPSDGGAGDGGTDSGASDAAATDSGVGSDAGPGTDSGL